MSISENKKVIAELQSKKQKDSKDAEEKYNKKVLAIEAKNYGLEKRITDSQHTKTNLWERFKINFTRDMEKLGEDIKHV